jgi:hypothetical protein
VPAPALFDRNECWECVFDAPSGVEAPTEHAGSWSELDCL